jgi:hypothetical protein
MGKCPGEIRNIDFSIFVACRSAALEKLILPCNRIVLRD